MGYYFLKTVLISQQQNLNKFPYCLFSEQTVLPVSHLEAENEAYVSYKGLVP